MRFLVDPPGAAPPGRAPRWPDLRRAFIGGMDGRVFPTAVELDGGVLVCRRDVSDSGRLHVPCPVEGFGKPVLSTASLRERPEAYVLAVELARGKLGQVRDQAAAWQQGGMAVPPEVDALAAEALDLFRRAACRQEEALADAVAFADASLAKSCAAADKLTEAYLRQRLAVRRRRSPHLPVLLGCPLGPVAPSSAWDRPFATAFNAAGVAVTWAAVEPVQGEYQWDVVERQLAWVEANRLTAVGGPLLDFGPDGLPPWLSDWANDYYALQSFVSDFVETVLTRYAGRIRLWEVAARANTGGSAGLDEEHRLALTARAIEAARQTDDELQLTLRVARPWGEYQADERHRLSPIQFVDAVVRSGVGLTGVTLEIAVGVEPEGAALRDRLEVSRLIDLWSSLGLPLTVSLAFPSQQRGDPRALEGAAVSDPQWRSHWSEAAQVEWASETLPLLMAKPAVVGIEWCHFSDAVPHRFPHAGLLRPDGTAKQALERLTRYRQAYWQRDRDGGE